MADPADSSADAVPPRRSRVSRGASSAASASSVSIDTENKLARAVQSAQRLAQLSDVPRDDSTLDLFPDDPTRSLVESMTIDVRQGTLSGFELPAVVRAAVEAVQGANTAESAPGASRKLARGKGVPVARRKADAVATGADSTVPTDNQESTAEEVADAADAARADALTAVSEPEVTIGGAATARDVAGAAGTAGMAVTAVAAPTAPTVATADAAPTPETVVTGDAAPMPGAAVGVDAAPASGAAVTADAAPPPEPAPHASEPLASPASRAARLQTASPELDRARATAFADTIDALYGVIADQRRAAAELTRRMKWMLAIVAGALLVTVGVGITQTLLLSRLARDAAAQQQRTAQLLQNQQSALTSVLERVAAPASASSAAAAVAARPVAAHPAPSTSVPRRLSHSHRAHPPAH